MASGQPVVEETWVEVLKKSDLDYLLKALITLVAMDFKVMITFVAMDFSWLGDGLSHKCDIPWQQPTEVHLTNSS